MQYPFILRPFEKLRANGYCIFPGFPTVPRYFA